MSKYVIEYDDWWNAEFDVDEEKALPYAKESVEFWNGHKERLERNDGDYIKTFLNSIAPDIIALSASHSLYGIQNKIADMEGYFPIDGNCGIELVAVDEFTFDTDRLTIEKINN